MIDQTRQTVMAVITGGGLQSGTARARRYGVKLLEECARRCPERAATFLADRDAWLGETEGWTT